MKKTKPHVILAYKNFSKDCNVSHQGLGITAAYTAKTLNKNGIRAVAQPIYGGDDLLKMIEHSYDSHSPITHVVIHAQFIPTVWLARICRKFPDLQVALNCHSNIGFLQAEPNAIKLLREAIDLELTLPNFRASGNNKRFVEALTRTYGHPVMFLPNLYYLHGNEPIHRPSWQGGTLRVGAFGSHRVYKNFSTAINAAVILSHDLKVNTEIWINSGRHDGAGNVVYSTALAWTKNVPGVQLRELHWATWPEFRKFVGHMNILLQPSYTETFNNVTADGVAAGTPSVVSDVIDWCPKSWQASTDDSVDIANTARRILGDCNASRDGYRSLRQYVSQGVMVWKRWVRGTMEQFDFDSEYDDDYTT